MNPGAAVRARAATTVAAVLNGENLDRSIGASMQEVPERDRGLYRELSFGTLRLYPRLDGILEQLLNKPLRKRDRDIHALALVGLYQLCATRVPAHAAVSATVDAASVLGKRQMAGMLNAVLRRFQREESDLLEALDEASAAAHPDWLWNQLGKEWPDHRSPIAEANNQRPPMTLRVNLSKTDRDSYRDRLAASGIESREGAAESALTLLEAVDVDQLPGFRDGWCSVQDAAAQWAAPLLNPAPGERILDACAAPGGKTGHLLEHQSDLEALVAMDISETRMQRVADNLQRLGVSAEMLIADGSRAMEELQGMSPFDAMLVDVPCSATGVIRRHPDIKALRRPSDLAAFARQQLALLDGLWPFLKPGGRLLYVTCSIAREENAGVVNSFLQSRPDARESTPPIPGAFDQNPGQQLLPSVDGGDGLYFAMLHRD